MNEPLTQNQQRFELHLDVGSSEQSVIELLSDNCALSKQQLKSAMVSGAVWLETPHGTRRVRRASKSLASSLKQTLHFYYDERILDERPQAAELIADEGDYTIWNKPYGMYCHGSKWGDQCTIYRWAEKHLEPQRDAFLVHRLDRATNGLIILVHNKRTAAAFGRMFQQRSIIKHYRARVSGKLTTGTPFHITEDIDGRRAESIVHAVDYDETSDTTLVQIQILTGRKHQIRKHLLATGHPIVGDRLYGNGEHTQDLQLTSCHLEFTCPVSNETKVYLI